MSLLGVVDIWDVHVAALSDLSPAQLIVLVGTCLSGLAACITAWAAIVRARRETRTEVEIQCLERLKAARLETESISHDLHRLRREMDS
jgi:hypothetical protein